MSSPVSLHLSKQSEQQTHVCIMSAERRRRADAVGNHISPRRQVRCDELCAGAHVHPTALRILPAFDSALQ